MSTAFYTNVQVRKNNILLRGYENGKRVQDEIAFKPFVFVPVKTESKYKTLDGNNVGKKKFNSIADAKEFVSSYDGVENTTIYGMTEWPYLFIYDNYPGEVQYDQDLIKIAYLDIEVEHDDGFPSPQRADKLITSINLRCNKKNYVFGYHIYEPENNDTIYTQCVDEEELLKRFLLRWNDLDFDIVSGWHVEGFDIQYLVNRLDKILGEGAHKMLSPWKQVNDRTTFDGGVIYDILGITILDYLSLYKKFSFKTLESYKLEDVSQEELGVGKHDFGDAISLQDLYKTDFKRFIDYNIIDCLRVEELEDKMRLIELVCARAYDAKCRFSDCLGTVKLWDTLIHSYLLDEKNIVIPPQKSHTLSKKLIGGYVKDVVSGEYKWVIGVDVRSEYPHVIMQWNISPETVGKQINSFSVRTYGGDEPDINPALFEGALVNHLGKDYAIAANGFKFNNSKSGFLADLMDKLFSDRKKYQALLKQAKINNDKKLISKYHNKQRALKDTLNSGYGALSNQYFRWFNFDLAEAITSSGQFTIRTVANKVNEYLNKMLKTDHDYVIASDTDSLFINLGPLVKKVYKIEPEPSKVTNMIDKFCKEQLMPEIEKCLEELAISVGAKNNRISMARETISDKAIWIAKKHYILNLRDEDGVRLEKPKLKIKGIEAVRSSTPMIVRDAIKKALFTMMNGTETELRQYIEEFRETFNSLPFEKMASPRSIAGLKKYSDATTIFGKGAPIQVKGALLYNHLLKKNKLDKKVETIQEGNKIKFSYLREPNPFNCNVIAAPGILPEEFGIHKYINYDLQFEKVFMDPITKITKAINWELASRSASLESFFS